MTIGTPLDRKTVWPGDGSDPPSPLNTSFPFFDNDEVLIYHLPAGGAYTLLTEGVEYTITAGGAGATGTIQPTDTIAIGDTWVGIRLTKHDQLQPYASEGTFPSGAHERQLDRAALARQDLDDDRVRSLRAPPYEDDDTYKDMILPVASIRASTILGFDVNSQPICVAGSIDSALVAVTAVGEAIVGKNTIAAVVAYLTQLTTRGDLLVRGAAGADTRLALNAHAGYVLTSDGNDPVWAENPRPYMHLAGLDTEWISATELRVRKGSCRAGSASDQDLVNAFNTNDAFDKLFDNGGWDAGDGGGGVPAACGFAAAQDDWHYFLLVKQDGTAYDFGYDTDPAAVNLIADASVIAALGASCFFRRIHSFRSSATPDIPRFTRDGDLVMLYNSVNDVSETSVGAANRDLYALSVPGDIKVRAIFDAWIDEAGAREVYLTSPDQDDQSCDNTVGRVSLSMGSAGSASAGRFCILTNTSRQIGARSDGVGCDLEIALVGWVDRRGKAN